MDAVIFLDEADWIIDNKILNFETGRMFGINAIVDKEIYLFSATSDSYFENCFKSCFNLPPWNVMQF